MRSRFLLTVLVSIFVFGFAGGYAQWVVYDCSVLPENASPPWEEFDITEGLTDNGVSDLCEVIDDPDITGNKLLEIEELLGDRRESWGYNWNVSDSSIGVTCAIRSMPTQSILDIQADDGSTYRYLYLSLRNGAYREKVSINYPDELVFDQIDSVIVLEDAEEWHIYRMTMKDNVISFYIDENPDPVLTDVTPKTSSDNHVIWGDNGTGNLYGELIDWVVWDTTGAYSPTEKVLPEELTGLPTTIENEVLTIPQRHFLHQNYPNPFNPSTEIRFDIGDSEWVTLSIYDITGKMITTLVDENKATGTYNVTWNGKDQNGNVVSAGIYLYRLQIGNTSLVKKMTMIK